LSDGVETSDGKRDFRLFHPSMANASGNEKHVSVSHSEFFTPEALPTNSDSRTTSNHDEGLVRVRMVVGGSKHGVTVHPITVPPMLASH
jgi:predicted polyphosphate/ATP-dependent NAD kinase